MNSKKVRKLKSGDEVYWNDPDGGLCSRVLKIQSIEFIWPEAVRILAIDGSTLEAFIWELS